MSDPFPSLRPSIWSEATAAIRHNFLPGLGLWIIASAVVAAYYLVPSAQPGFEAISDWKFQGGFLYSVGATALFAGLIPFLFLWARPSTRNAATAKSLVFLVVFWGYRGFEIDLLYRFQSWMFGNEVKFAVVAPKVAFDLLVYNVVWAAALQLLAYDWMNTGFSRGAFRAFAWKEFVTRRVPVALVSTWVIWLPVVSLVYSLPSDLQIPLFNLAACFWALVVATLTTQKRGTTEEPRR